MKYRALYDRVFGVALPGVSLWDRDTVIVQMEGTIMGIGEGKGATWDTPAEGVGTDKVLRSADEVRRWDAYACAAISGLCAEGGRTSTVSQTVGRAALIADDMLHKFRTRWPSS